MQQEILKRVHHRMSLHNNTKIKILFEGIRKSTGLRNCFLYGLGFNNHPFDKL